MDVVAIMLVVWGFFRDWLLLFSAPFQYPSMLWIILPIYASWIITEFYQEKLGTSFGNAITNGVVVLWVGIDWFRTLVDVRSFAAVDIMKFGMAFVVFCYGFVVVWHGIQTRRYVHFLGKIRNVSYVMLTITPFMYGVIPLSFRIIFAILIFFPLFYYVVEFINYLVPDPKAIKVDARDAMDGVVGMPRKQSSALLGFRQQAPSGPAPRQQAPGPNARGQPPFVQRPAMQFWSPPR